MPKSRGRCTWRTGAWAVVAFAPDDGAAIATATDRWSGRKEALVSTKRAFMTISSGLRGRQPPEWGGALRAAEQRLEGVAGIAAVVDVAAAVAVADAEIAFAMQMADLGGLGGGSGLGGVVAAGFEGADVHGVSSGSWGLAGAV